MTVPKWKLLFFGIALVFIGFTAGYLLGDLPAISGVSVLSVTQISSEASQPEQIPLNTATQEELMRLPYIGETIATQIVEYRESHGNFQSLDELKNVKGIGDKTFDRIAPFLTLGTP